MITKLNSAAKHEYDTSELKLAALILSEVPGCTFEVYEQGNSIRKAIKITYPVGYKDTVSLLEKDYINKMALSNIYKYNKALNLIRDRLKGCVKWEVAKNRL